MEQAVQLECYNCRILYPGMPKCGVCGGTGMRSQPAQMADEQLSHEILRDALERLNVKEGTILSGRSHLVRTLILWQIYGVGYVSVEKRVMPGTPEHARELLKIRDRILGEIRKLDKM